MLINCSTIPVLFKNNAHIDPIDRNITNAGFIQVNPLPQIDSHLTAKLYVDNFIVETSLVRNNQDKDFNNHNLTSVISITVTTQAVNDEQVITKSYVDQFQQENERSRRDIGLQFYDESSDLVENNQDNDFSDDKIINLDSVTVSRNPTSDNKLANKKYIDDDLDKDTVLRFNRTIENYLKVSVGKDVYNLIKKIQLTDTTTNKYPNSGGYLLQKWLKNVMIRLMLVKDKTLYDQKKTNSPSSNSGAESLPPLGDSFKYFETSSNNHAGIVFVSFERTDVLLTSNKTFYYNRYSLLPNGSLKSMGRFRIQLFFDENSWSTQNTIPKIPKNTQYTNSPTE